MSTLVELVHDAAQTYGDDPALIMHAGLRDEIWSYGRLWSAAASVASYLREQRGLRSGDRVLLCAPNQPRWVASLLGAMVARAIPVPLDAFVTPEFAARVARDSEARLLISGAPLEVPGVQRVALGELPLEAQTSRALAPPEPGDIAEILYTSGPTGNLKGVVLTHANILANVLAADQLIRHSERWRLLSLLPLSHMLEQTVGLFAQLYRGSTVVYGGAHHPAAIVKALRRYRIVAMVVVPHVLLQMLRELERAVERRGASRLWRWQNRLAAHLPLAGRRLLWHPLLRELGGALEVFMCGGAHLPGDVAQGWERLGVPVVQGYGATECSPIIAGNTLAWRVPGAVGRAVAGVELRIASDGEVQVRGESVSSGYWRNEAATSAAFTPDGWFRTGDLGDIDAEGNLYIRGHVKDMVALPSGLNVFLEDLEAALRQQAGVRDCVALDTPQPAGGVAFTAVVIGECGEEALRSANAQLAQHQRLSTLVHWDAGDFPRTEQGRVKRADVRTWLERRSPAGVTSPATAVARERRESRLAGVLSEVSGVAADRITPQSDLNLDLALSSLSRVELALALEERFGVVIDDGELATIETVAQLAERLGRGATDGVDRAFTRWPVESPACVVRSVLQRLLLFPLHALVARPFRVLGLETLETLQLPALFIANHASHIDTVSIIRALPPRIRRTLAVAAAADYFYKFSALGAVASLVLNTFPFSREGAVRASLEHCGELADQGWSVLIFPEGTRSRSGALQPFKSGIGMLAVGLDMPVVPIAVLGGHGVLPKGRVLPRPGVVQVTFGVPLRLRRGIALDDAVARLQRAVADLMRAASTEECTS